MRYIKLNKDEIQELCEFYDWCNCPDELWLFEDGTVYKKLSDSGYWALIELDDVEYYFEKD